MTSSPCDPAHAEIFKNIYVDCKIGKIMEIYEMTLVWISVGLNKSKLSRLGARSGYRVYLELNQGAGYILRLTHQQGQGTECTMILI